MTPERGEHLDRGVDGVEAEVAGARRVRRDAGEIHVEPENSDLGDGQMVGMGLGDDARVGPRPVEQTLQRAVPRAFFLHDGLQLYVRGGGVAGTHERPHRAGHGGEAGLHIARAAAVDPIALAHRLERRVRPQFLGGRRHDVDVAVEDERAPAATTCRPARDDVALALDVPGEG